MRAVFLLLFFCEYDILLALRVWWNGRHVGLRSQCQKREGSSPFTRTKFLWDSFRLPASFSPVIPVFKFHRHSERSEESTNHGCINMDSSVVVLPQNDKKDTNFPIIIFS